jgi:hypothetical protein
MARQRVSRSALKNVVVSKSRAAVATTDKGSNDAIFRLPFELLNKEQVTPLHDTA